MLRLEEANGNGKGRVRESRLPERRKLPYFCLRYFSPLNPHPIRTQILASCLRLKVHPPQQVVEARFIAEGLFLRPRCFEQLDDFDVAPLYRAIPRIALARFSSFSASALHNPALGTQKEERKTSLK